MQVLLSPRIGGAESLAFGLSEVWSTQSIMNTVYFLDPDTLARTSRLSRITRLKKEIARLRPDVILAHTAIPNIYSRLASPKGVPVVIVLHSSGDDYSSSVLRIAERALSARTQHVVGVGTRQVAEYTEHFGDGVSISSIANGVRSGLSVRTPATSEPKTILTLARVADVKNPWLWAEVAARIGVNHGNLAMEWWGPAADAAMIDFVTAQAAERGIGTFMGPTPDPLPQLDKADILFHPSDRESLGLTVIEAACMGIPVVCSEAVASVLPEELSVSTFVTGSASSATASLAMAIRNFPALSEKARRQAAMVGELYSLELCAERYIRVCKEAVETSKHFK